MTSPRFRAAVVSCLLLVASALWTRETSAQGGLLPNLRAFPAANVIVVNDANGLPELRFSTTSWNGGAGPLEIVPGAPLGDGTQPVYQRIYQPSGPPIDHLAGNFVFHPDHGHFHLEDYALYSLKLAGTQLGQSVKTSFCLIDTTKVNLRLPGAPRKAVYASCGNATQGISVGWGDTYGSYLEGQSISLNGAPEGDYELTIAYNPAGHLVESSYDDNAACSLLHINPATSTVQQVGGCGSTPGGEVTIDSINPSFVRAGTSTSVTIYGTNFTNGTIVSFTNGSGPAPVASNVTVLDGGTISATVTVKNGGNLSDPVWDLQVGSAVKANALTVTR